MSGTGRRVFFHAVAASLLGALAACSEPKPADGLLEPAATLATAQQGAINVPPDAAFYPYRCAGTNAGDTSGDPVTGNRERDLVGDATFPAFYRAADATDVFFRMRIDISPLKNNGVDLQPSSWDVLVDTDNNLSTYEFMLTADGNMAGTKVRWVRNSIKEPGNPRDPANENPATDMLADFTPATDYYSVKLATDGSNFKGDPDYFVTVRIPKATLQAAGLNLNNSFVVWGGTNAQNYSLNADFGCYVGIPPNLDVVAPEPGPLDPAGTPDAINDTATTPEDTPVTTTVLANDIGLRDTPITVTIPAQPTIGTATVVGTTVRYTPPANYPGNTPGAGPVTYTYRIQDADGQFDTATVTVTVTEVNDPPTGVADAFSVSTNSGATTLSVLANDSTAPDNGVNETLTVASVTQPASGGSVSVAPGGAGVVFTPANGFSGTVTFTYTVSDGRGGTRVVTVTVSVVAGTPPDAVDDMLVLNEDDGPTVVDVLANDTLGSAGGTKSVASVSQPPVGGSVTQAGNTVTFTPTPHFGGTTTFSYTLADGNGGTDTATVTVQVTERNDQPDAVDDAYTMGEDGAATVLSVRDNDTILPDQGETLTVTTVTQPTTGGSVVIAPGGTGVTFTPTAHFHGAATFMYTVSDGRGGTDTANVTVTVNEVNDPPTGVADTYSVPAGSGATTLTVLTNDSNAPDQNTGETLAVSAVTPPASGGTVTVAPNGGGVVFTPAAGFSGTVTFTYTLADSRGGTTIVTVTVNVTNNPPVANDDEVTVDEDSGATVVSVLTNDSTAPDNNETLTVTAVTQPADGTVTQVGNTVSYQPNANFYGTDSFTYTVSDGNGGTDTATVTVTVNELNDPPDAVDDTLVVNEDSSATVVSVLDNDRIAPDRNETLTVTAVTQPTRGGTVAVAQGSTEVTFTPALHFFGTVTFMYTVSDGRGGTDTATVTVTVNEVNDPPTGVADTYSVPAGNGPTTLSVLTNDSNAPDTGVNETLTVSAVTQPASGGTVTIAPGSTEVVFTPAAGFSGTVTFTYTLSDGRGGTTAVTVTVNVTNNPPVANDDAVTVNEDSGATVVSVLTNDSTAPDNNETLTVTAATRPADGTVTRVGNTVSYQPNANFYGTDSFTYTVSDGNGGTDTATVTVTVTEVNDPPTGVADTYSVPAGSGATTLSVLTNDSNAPDTGVDETLTVSAVTPPASGGTVTVAPNGGGVVFTPAAGFSGTVTFTYTLSDGRGGTTAVTVTVNVTNNPPVANDDEVTVNEDSGATVVSVLTNDSTAPDNNETLTVTAATQPADGTVTRVGNMVSYQPNANFYGTDSFTYTVSDGNGGTDTATVTVTVNELNDPPDAVDDTLVVNEDSGATVVSVLDNDRIAPDRNETLTVTAVTQPTRGGTVAVAPGGTGVTFTPAPHFFGTVTFMYTVSDGRGGTDTATVTVTVNEVNDPPTGVADTYSVPAGNGPTTLNVLNNDSNAPDTGVNETLTVTAVTQPASGGTVTIAPGSQEVVFTPGPDFTGSVTFTYTVSDGRGGSTTVTVTLNAGNNPPVATDDEVTVDEDSGATVVTVLANDSSAPDAETLTVTAVTQPATGGTVEIAQGGTEVTFTPAPDFNGTATFMYTVSDGNGGTDTATVTVTVNEVNDPPTGRADTFPVPGRSGPTALPVLTNDSSAPDSNETLTVTAVTPPTIGGTVTVAPDGSGVVFTPTPGFVGTVTFTYTLSDGRGGTATVQVTVNVAAVDSDNDGIDDHIEKELGLDPNDADNDDDGVPDGQDGLTDTDRDGTIDALDPDSDDDGLTDGTERGVTAESVGPGTNRSSPNFQPDADPSTTTDPLNPDTDGDGLKDGREDADHDGRVGDTESDPNDADSDDGGENDGAEADFGGNPRDYADDLSVAGRGCASTGTGTLLPLMLLLALPLLRRRRAVRGSAGAWSLLGLLAAVLVAMPARAQGVAPGSQGIDVQQYKPGPGLRDVLGLHSSQVGRHLDWNLGLSFNYAKDPLNFLNPRTDTFTYELVKNQFTFDVMGAIALYDRFELGVGLPITSQASGSGTPAAPGFAGGVDATGVGDLRLVPKARLLSTEGGLHVGLTVPLLLPTSGGKEFLGRSGVAVSPRLTGEWMSEGGTRVLANVGFNFQPSEQLYNLNVGNEFAYGVGTEVPFQLGRHRLAAEATLMGALGLKQRNSEERPLELLGALKYRFSDAVAAHLGGGPGLTRGYGTPGFRMFAGLIWTQAERVIPARVVPPPAPMCPLGPEDVDGFEDGDSCADPDNDQDGLEDAQDRCPNQPEARNGFEDEDGCADAVPPPPPVDTDGDGLTDDQDKCPGAVEDMDGFEDGDGCAEQDNDKDGVADAADKCPAEPETINGVDDADGCPDKGKVKVLVEGEKIIILEKVYFATKKDVILKRSFNLLQQVAAVLRANPYILKVRVEGHTDSQGTDKANQNLSQRRANSVRRRLVEQEGIAPERLEAVGYGETKPVDTNKTSKGRENNRRVEFTILETKKAQVE